MSAYSSNSMAKRDLSLDQYTVRELDIGGACRRTYWVRRQTADNDDAAAELWAALQHVVTTYRQTL